MWDLKACTVCLSMDIKLYNMDKDKLRYHFNLLTGLQIEKANGMPEYLCYECHSYVKNFVKFRDKCHRAHFVLKVLLENNKEIHKSTLQAIDCDSINIKRNLSFINTNKAHYEEIKFQWVKSNRSNVMISESIPTLHCTTLNKEDIFEIPCPNNDNIAPVKEEIVVKLQNDESANNDANEKIGQISSYSYPDDSSQLSDGNDYLDSDDAINVNNESNIKVDVEINNVKNTEVEADGTELDTEYATLYTITKKEAKEALEIYKTFSVGKFKCSICRRGFGSQSRLGVHLRMHDKYVSGTYWCDLCDYYYKTEFLLKTHVTEKHMYKYVCKKCPEVSFDRTTAKQHYILSHMHKRFKKNEEWEKSRPSWMTNKGGKPKKVVMKLSVQKKSNKLPDDFLVYAPVSQKEQYELVESRKITRNYIDSKFKCEMCYRGYREQETYNNHMRKHDPEHSGNIQCDMCKLYFKNTLKLYKHMNITHLYKYSCQLCDFICYNKGQAHMHYRWHNNVTYSCPHCDKVFKKVSTRLTHIRIKHPSTYICNLCGHSFVSQSGLYCHKQLSHSTEETDPSLSKPVDTSDPYYCGECLIQFANQTAFTTHLGSSNKHATTNFSLKAKTGKKRAPGRPRRTGASDIVNNGSVTATTCEVCGEVLVNDVQARKHYEAQHPGAEFLKRYMCDVCGHTTKQYANLMVHMRTHTNEKPYQCPHCDRRFSMPSNRDRHIVVHTGEKRYQCQLCHRRFTQSSAVKLHIQTVHMKIPYAPWDKKNRKRRKDSAGINNVDPAPCVSNPPQTQKLVFDQGDYLNAYITYNE